MKSKTGIVRKLDELGRITLPIELRRTLGIEDKDELSILVEDNKIILTKVEQACIFTGEKDDLIEYEGKKISKKSIVALAKEAGLTAADL
ncbi:MAG: AbrB/MazE/SpoVT family DNA-binding domain-containing protein [Lachnospiraceae bacterium]|nr:AbrB/MazE/SpoVT family DNA-binding domain-containing protein [Lachnospiraceae bacterium]